ncbi:MAG: omptin family outer membrane protease [Spirochaetales bacterium]|nr:omptin family outer membrane protease [Spirochaetales bacterium]
MELNTNKAKFKYLILFLYLIIILSNGFSQDNTPFVSKEPNKEIFTKDINFTIGTGLSYLNGQYKEIVYPSAEWESPYLSELLWNLDNIFLLNLKTGVQWGSWAVNLSVSTALTTETGEMTDTDWLEPTSTDRTHWSLSRIWLDNSFLLNTDIIYEYSISQNISFTTGFGYSLNFWDWEDEVLDFIYQDPQPADFIGENGIDYKVIQNIFYASAEIIYSTGIIFSGININLSPFIYTWDMDHHILTNTFYIDSFYANFWYRAEFTLGIKTGKHEKLIISLFREELPETLGDTYEYDEDQTDSEEIGIQTGYYPNGAGMASILWGIELSYIWTF